MVAPTKCACGKVFVLLHDLGDKKLCKECLKKAKAEMKEANKKKEEEVMAAAKEKREKAKAAAEAPKPEAAPGA